MRMIYLLELEQRFREQEKLTTDEQRVLKQAYAKLDKGLLNATFAGTCVGVGLLAVDKLCSLRMLNRIGLSTVAGCLIGWWNIKKSLHSCVQHILDQEGSLMQAELARIMLRIHPNSERVRVLISKHFYPEKVFDDLTLQLKSVWRLRNLFVDSAANPVKTRNSNLCHDDFDVEPKQISMNSGFVSMANPFDCVFGLPPPGAEEMQLQSTVTSSKSPRKRRHGQKRSHPKHHRVHNQEAA